jgi:hypothetical protein
MADKTVSVNVIVETQDEADYFMKILRTCEEDIRLLRYTKYIEGEETLEAFVDSVIERLQDAQALKASETKKRIDINTSLLDNVIPLPRMGSDVQRRINESMKSPAFKELWENDDFIDPLEMSEEDLKEYFWEDDDE